MARIRRMARWASCRGTSACRSQPSPGASAVAQHEAGDPGGGQPMADLEALLVDHHPDVAAARRDQHRRAVGPARAEDGHQWTAYPGDEAILEAGGLHPVDDLFTRQGRLRARRPVRPERHNLGGVGEDRRGRSQRRRCRRGSGGQTDQGAAVEHRGLRRGARAEAHDTGSIRVSGSLAWADAEPQNLSRRRSQRARRARPGGGLRFGLGAGLWRSCRSEGRTPAGAWRSESGSSAGRGPAACARPGDRQRRRSAADLGHGPPLAPCRHGRRSGPRSG